MSAERVFHPLNSSSSKQEYTFGTSKRTFMKSKEKSAGYVSLPPALSTKSFKFSKGSRIVFADPTKDNPPIGAYQLASLANSRSTCFEKQALRDTHIRKSSSPGPGSYNISSDISKSPIKFSITSRPKTRDVEKSPGPSEYYVPDSINKVGRYVNSKISSKNVKGLNFTGSRFASAISDSPGPGTYADTAVTFSRLGSYYVNPYNSSLAQKFGRASRKTFVLNHDVPGPGTYTNFSDFGDHTKGYALTDRKRISRARTESRAQTEIASRDKALGDL